MTEFEEWAKLAEELRHPLIVAPSLNQVFEEINELFDLYNKHSEEILKQLKLLNQRVTRLESAMTEAASILKPKPETPDPAKYQ